VLDQEEFKRWLRQASYTLESARRDREARDYAWACFKAEQAGQFALKALLRGLGRPAFGHSASSLVEKVQELGIAVPQEILDSARELERHYILSRYPDSYPAGTPFEYYRDKDAEEAISCAEKILEFVQKVWEDAQSA
jgi:Uncharacterized conserved protein related to C-terminal domain of eukaryotic chaperone, SACSIN